MTRKRKRPPRQKALNRIFKDVPKRKRRFKPVKRSKSLHAMIIKGAEFWNSEREKRPRWQPNFEFLNFSGFDFSDFDLSFANLKYANFSECDLQRANLRNAVVTFTNFGGSILTDADLRGAKNLTKEQLESAKDGRGLKYDEPSFQEPQLKGDTARVFLSYSWSDKALVLAVDQWLRDHGARVILDERNFSIGENIREEIIHWIQEAGIIVCFISKDSKDRPYPRLEREIAEALRGTGEKRVIYFNLDNTMVDILQTTRLYVPGHELSFDEACEMLWRGILRTVAAPKPINLRPLKKAGKDWTKLS